MVPPKTKECLAFPVAACVEAMKTDWRRERSWGRERSDAKETKNNPKFLHVWYSFKTDEADQRSRGYLTWVTVWGHCVCNHVIVSEETTRDQSDGDWERNKKEENGTNSFRTLKQIAKGWEMHNGSIHIMSWKPWATFKEFPDWIANLNLKCVPGVRLF